MKGVKWGVGEMREMRGMRERGRGENLPLCSLLPAQEPLPNATSPNHLSTPYFAATIALSCDYYQSIG